MVPGAGSALGRKLEQGIHKYRELLGYLIDQERNDGNRNGLKGPGVFNSIHTQPSIYLQHR